MNEEKRNLTISGTGSAPGGIYRNVQINGSGKIQGDVQCDLLEINGSGKVSGKTLADQVVISGSGVSEGNVQARSVTINGMSRIEGNVIAESIQVNGTARINGDIGGERVKSSGILKVERNLEVEELVAEGQLLINGLCSAERIEIRLSFASRIKEIGCSTIEVRRKPFANVLGQLFESLKKQGLTVDSIEGDDIYLEETAARTVRGNRVTIGAGCVINEVTYKSDYQKAESAKVNSAVRE